MAASQPMTTPFIIEEISGSHHLVVTGRWTGAASAALRAGDIDGLVLNYARGFSEPTLEFLEDWPIRHLEVLAPDIADLEPISRMRRSLESITIEAAREAELWLDDFDRLRSIAGEWGLLRAPLARVIAVEEVTTWTFGDPDCRAFRDLVALRRLTIKDAPLLESLSGLDVLQDLKYLSVVAAKRVSDIQVLATLLSIIELSFEGCPSIESLDPVANLVHLQFLEVGDCGAIASLAPLASLNQLNTFYGWGSTEVVDRDLSPLASLPRLTEVRMRNRRGYRPQVSELSAAVF